MGAIRGAGAIGLISLLASFLASCQSLAETIYKGRPPNPSPKYLSGSEPVPVWVVRWIHPQVFEGTFQVDGDWRVDNFIEVENLAGYRVDTERRVYFPSWASSASVALSTPESRAISSYRHPPGTIMMVSFPLKGREVYTSDPTFGAQPTDQDSGDVRTYLGYLIRIER